MASGSLLTLPAGQNGSQVTEIRNPSAAHRDLDRLTLRVVTRLDALEGEFEAWDDLARAAHGATAGHGDERTLPGRNGLASVMARRA